MNPDNSVLSKRVILVVCDGLGFEWLSPKRAPVLTELSTKSLSFEQHQAVFPSVTRVSSASIATGCYPGKHGLHGNQMGLYLDERLQVFNAGDVGFRDLMRSATGTTLQTKTLAQYLVNAGGQVVYSNVSPGAAYFLDPEHFGHVHHRSGSFASGGEKITDHRHLNVSHDLAGDLEATTRFCKDVVLEGNCSLGILWLANPDLTLHYQQPGSPEHLEALSATDQMVEMVSKAVQAARNEAEILFVVTSDHGHEVIGDSIHITQWLAVNGLSHEIQAGDICVAGQGTSALLYATEHGKARLTEKLEHIKQQEWVAAVLDAEQLARLGLPKSRHLAMGIDMARFDTVNAYGVSGARWMVEDGEKGVAMHCGQHGGLGPQETHPFLFINHPAHAAATMTQRTSLVDIAPTILDLLGVPHEAMDGQSLLKY